MHSDEPKVTLDEDQLFELRELIIAQIAENDETARQISTAAQTVELDQNRVGRLSRMDAMQGQALAQASSSRLHQFGLELSNALRRLDAQRFGLCEECDEAIAFGRLRADPTAKFCVACAQALERR